MTDFLSTCGLTYAGSARWDFGLGCPNKAAALIAPLAVVFIVYALRLRKPLASWLCGIVFCALAYALVHTFSRGGFVAFAAGAVLALAIERKRLFERRFHMLAVFAVIASALFTTGFARRLAMSSPALDDSVGNRLELWSSAARMMADSPCGWGEDRAGAAYMSWYQNPERAERYRTLVNSPLTHMVESGWSGRWLTLFLSFLLCAALAARLREKDTIAVCVWLVFLISSFFSTVAENALLWVVPAAALCPLVRDAVSGLKSSRSAAARCLVRLLLFGVAGATIGCGAIAAAARLGGEKLQIRHVKNGSVIVGNGMPDKWIVYDAQVMGRDAYGKSLRGWMLSDSPAVNAVGVAMRSGDVPATARRVTFCGANANADALALLGKLSAETEVNVLSPRNPDLWLGVAGRTVRVFCGELTSECPAEGRPGLTVLPGRGRYLPQWPSLAFGPFSR